MTKLEAMNHLMAECERLGVLPHEFYAWGTYLDCKESMVELIQDSEGDAVVSPEKMVQYMCEAELDDPRDSILIHFQNVAEIGKELDPDYEKDHTGLTNKEES
jgi:hypothetical protein